MKRINISYSLHFFALIFLSSIAFAQVGINTTDPKGVLDFNSSTLGVVYPNVALIATDDPTPVVNPQGGSLVPGTVVYNTARTQTGAATDVFPGIYVWDGSEWIVHYKKRQSELHSQTALLRTEANFIGDWEDIPGLGISDFKTFTATYTGLYRIEVKANFGGGRTETNSSIFVSQASGQFRFLLGATPYTFETSAFSAYSSYINSGTHYDAIWKESYETNYVTLVAGQTYPFSLSFNAYDAPGFIGNGSTTLAGPPTSVDLINEDFENPYTVVQIHTPDAQCSTDGWEVSTDDLCTSCSGNALNISGKNNNCTQDATALMSFTPSLSTIDISFDYLFVDRSGKNDSFRVYLHNGTTQVGADLVNIDNSGSVTTNTSYSGSSTIIPGIPLTLRFEYINGVNQARHATVDNVVISELSGPSPTTSSEGRGYVGNDVKCQIEFTYIGE